MLCRRSSGFTLIELLVVIAIIAILAAILFPVFAQAREKARAITCISNEKQISTGVLMYCQDYDEYFPGGQMYGTPGTDWTTEIQPYIKNGNQTKSSWNNGVSSGGGIWTCPSSPMPLYMSYAMRADVFPNFWNNHNSHAEAIASIDAPAQKVMGFEMGDQGYADQGVLYMIPTNLWYWFSTGNYADLTQNHSPDWPYRSGDCDQPAGTVNWWGSCAQYPRYRHTKTTNIMWLDGHVKSMPRGQLDWYRDIYNAATDGNSWQ